MVATFAHGPELLLGRARINCFTWSTDNILYYWLNDPSFLALWQPWLLILARTYWAGWPCFDTWHLCSCSQIFHIISIILYTLAISQMCHNIIICYKMWITQSKYIVRFLISLFVIYVKISIHQEVCHILLVKCASLINCQLFSGPTRDCLDFNLSIHVNPLCFIANRSMTHYHHSWMGLTVNFTTGCLW